MAKEEYEYEIKHIVLPKFNRAIYRCQNCKTMFVSKRSYFKSENKNEVCPFCAKTMSRSEEISLWEYNLIRWFRGDFYKSEKQKVKELEERIAESGGEQVQGVRKITCEYCKYGRFRPEFGTYECIHDPKHGYNNKKNFYCKDSIDKSITQDKVTLTR